MRKISLWDDHGYRGSRRGKMGLGFDCFFDWEMGFLVLGMGFLSMGMGKRTLNGNEI